MKTPKRKTGDIGEGVAAKYYENKGFSVVERNYLKPWGEIDIIVRKPASPAGRANLLVFVEVKSVSREAGEDISREKFRPEENVHPAKLKRLHRAIQTYLLERKVPENIEWRIDVACVYLDFGTRKAKVEVLENVIL